MGLALMTAGRLLLVVVPHLHERLELVRYRSTMQELSESVRTMQWKAVARQCTFELRPDAQHRSFQLVALSSPSSMETVERTVWLPKGLEIAEATSRLRAWPTGQLAPASILIAAVSYGRLFQLTTNETGRVQWREEPIL